MDQHVRELLRRWHETGDAQDEERYLRARMRLGSLPWVNLELAAYLGDEVARGFLGEDGLAIRPQRGLRRFFERLPARCPETYRQVVVAALRGFGRGTKHPEALRGIEAARAWVAKPAPERRQAAAVALIALQGTVTSPVSAACRDVLRVIAQEAEEAFSEWLVPWERFAVLRRKPDVDAVFQGVREYVVPWALALEDALPEREGWDPQDLPDDPDLREIYSEYLEEHESFVAERAEARATRTLGGGGEEELFTAGRMDPQHAAKVLEAVGLDEARKWKRLPVTECKVAIEAYYEARGWKLKRGSLYAPSNQRRIKLKKRALRIEVGGPGNWRKKPATAGHEILLSAHGKALVEAALASIPLEVLEAAQAPPAVKKAKARKAKAARKAVRKAKPKRLPPRLSRHEMHFDDPCGGRILRS